MNTTELDKSCAAARCVGILHSLVKCKLLPPAHATLAAQAVAEYDAATARVRETRADELADVVIKRAAA